MEHTGRAPSDENPAVPLHGRAEGHWGEWMQGRLGSDGPLVLVTLRCPGLFVRASLSRSSGFALTGRGRHDISPDWLARLVAGSSWAGGATAEVSHNMVPASGMGLSTAALVALSRAAGIAPARIPATCLALEGATDPTMLETPDGVLWLPRRAQALEPIAPPPVAEILGGTFGGGLRTDPVDDDFPDISDLIAPWRAGTERGDLRTLADLASSSAERTTALRGPQGDPAADLTADLGALGHTRAHTGSLRGFVFCPGTAPGDAEARLREAGFANVRRFLSGTRA
ncbi:MAG: hypothetical protein AAGF74_05165 [Pseudomonadota bacterium]